MKLIGSLVDTERYLYEFLFKKAKQELQLKLALCRLFRTFIDNAISLVSHIQDPFLGWHTVSYNSNTVASLSFCTSLLMSRHQTHLPVHTRHFS